MNLSDFQVAVAQGPLQAAFVAFLGGVLVSLTPCVYPMIAITVSLFGARKATRKLEGAGLSLSFVLGIVAMFTPLGVVAGMSGSLFGAVLQNTYVVIFVAAIFLAMAASLFGAFEVALPAALTNRLASVNALGARGAFALGLACGLIAAPCTGPVLTGILTWIAQTQSPLGGGLAMFAFSLGLGLPFFLVGTFAVHLPKSGAWMVHVKSVLAIVLAIVGLYYLSTAFPALTAWIHRSPTTFAVGSGAILAGILLGAVHRDFGSPAIKDKVLKSVGASLVTCAGFVIVSALGQPESALKWEKTSFVEAKRLAASKQQPLLVDFTATWCGACKKLDSSTFSDPAVRAEAGRFVAVKVDATNDDDPAVQRTMSELGVVGLPTVLLISSAGKEAARFTDFVEPEPFLKSLRVVR
jgi:thioredoxin:protein disulfide reductase